MSALVTKVIDILSPSLSSLLTNPHASPPIRLLLVVLTSSRVVPALDGGEEGLIRSKKSGKYRKGQSVKGKSILEDGQEENTKGKAVERRIPEDLLAVRKRVLEGLMSAITPVEWKSMGIDPVGSAAVQLLLEIEVEDQREKLTASLLDIVTDGLVDEICQLSKARIRSPAEQIDTKKNSQPAASHYPASLLTSPSGTRMIEAILTVSPIEVFQQIWKLYFSGSIGRYAGHPFDNFVVAKGVSRLDAEGIEEVVRECKAVAGARGLISECKISLCCIN